MLKIHFICCVFLLKHEVMMIINVFGVHLGELSTWPVKAQHQDVSQVTVWCIQVFPDLNSKDFVLLHTG